MCHQLRHGQAHQVHTSLWRTSLSLAGATTAEFMTAWVLARQNLTSLTILIEPQSVSKVKLCLCDNKKNSYPKCRGRP